MKYFSPGLLIVLFVVSFVSLFSEVTQAKPLFMEEDFKGYSSGSTGFPDWETSGIGWEIRDGEFISTEPGKDFAVLVKAPWSEEGEMEASLVVSETTSAGWKVAGIGIYADNGHYWQLALGEAPDGEGKRHFIELAEMYDGQWLAQSQGPTALRASDMIFTNAGWEYGKSYRLQLEWTIYGIRATVLTSGGVLIARRGYQFAKGQPAMRIGKPMLVNGGFNAAFDRIKISVVGGKESPLPQPKEPPKYNMKGYKKVRAEATGFFRTERIDDTWWTIDPNGYGFYMVGTDHCNYNVHWCQELGYAPYHKFISEKYDSEAAWSESATDRLKDWNFNTLGANNSPSTRHRGLVHTEFLSLGTQFAKHDNIAPQVHWTGFPNVFNPKFRQFCRKKAKQQCETTKNDPWLIGYFIDNELEWFGKTHTEWGLTDEVLKKSPEHEAKIAFVNFIKTRYEMISEFNSAWGLNLQSFDDILNATDTIETNTEAGIEDKKEFVRIIAEKYFEATTGAIREFDPNHLILGVRFAGRSPNIWDIAGKYCDVVSVNCYRHINFKTRTFADGFEEDLGQWYQQAQKPLMITEWSFPALDTELPSVHGAGQRVPTQKHKALAYSIFQRKVFSLPYLVGSMYFMWADEPALGISEHFPEDSNYGLVNVEDEPYEELVKTAKHINGHVYDLHSGRTPKLRASFVNNNRIEVRNSGNASASTKMVTYVDGRRKNYTVRVSKQSSRTYRLPKKNDPGGHFYFAQINPDGKTIEPDFIDHRIEKAYYVHGLQESLKLEGQFSPLVVVNNGQRQVNNPICTVDIERIGDFDTSKWNDNSVPFVLTGDENLQPVPVQMDLGPCRKELAFSPEEIGPYGVKTFLIDGDNGNDADESKSITTDKTLDNGVLKIHFSDQGEAIIDSVMLGDFELGEFAPQIHQKDSRDFWVKPNGVEDIWVRRGPLRSVVQTVLSYDATDSEDSVRPKNFRTCYQFEIEPDKNYFISKFLWLKNTDEQPLNLVAYFHSPYSNIRGNSEDDVAATNLFHPSSILSAAGWKDGDLYYGAMALPENGMQIIFWKDPAGGQHPDLMRRTDVRLAPGERYVEEGLPVIIFGTQANAETNPLDMEIPGTGSVEVYTNAQFIEK